MPTRESSRKKHGANTSSLVASEALSPLPFCHRLYVADLFLSLLFLFLARASRTNEATSRSTSSKTLRSGEFGTTPRVVSSSWHDHARWLLESGPSGTCQVSRTGSSACPRTISHLSSVFRRLRSEEKRVPCAQNTIGVGDTSFEAKVARKVTSEDTPRGTPVDGTPSTEDLSLQACQHRH